MWGTAIMFLIIGHTDWAIRKVSGAHPHPVSIQIYHSARLTGYILLAAFIGSLLIPSVYWNIAYLSVCYMSIKAIRATNHLRKEGLDES